MTSWLLRESGAQHPGSAKRFECGIYGALTLHQPADTLDRNVKQLAARVAFFEGDSNLLIFEKENVVNRYGETTEVVRHVKHIFDDESVQVSGLCEDISEEKAEALKAKQVMPSPTLEKQNAGVTIVINCSSKSAEQEPNSKMRKRKPRRVRENKLWRRKRVANHKNQPKMDESFAALQARRWTRYKTNTQTSLPMVSQRQQRISEKLWELKYRLG